MSIIFFSPSELEDYYNKSFNDISPVDSPLKKFMVGHKNINCDKCENKINVTCNGIGRHKNSLNGFIDIAYCENCDIQYTRDRTSVKPGNLEYQYSFNRTDEREEYVCSYCHQRHPITKPQGKFTAPKQELCGEITLPCKCGKYVRIYEYPMEINCSKCGREYIFK